MGRFERLSVGGDRVGGIGNVLDLDHYEDNLVSRVKSVEGRTRELEASPLSGVSGPPGPVGPQGAAGVAGTPGPGAPAPLTQGDILVVDAVPEITTLAIGNAHEMLKVNAAGTDPAWEAFDWDEMSGVAGADMAHSHQSAAEGAQIALAALSDHNKAAHDALNIDADTVDALHAASFIRADADDLSSGRTQWSGASNGNAYNQASIEIIEAWAAGAGEGPHISFHYSGAVASQIGYMKGDSSGNISILANPGTGYEDLRVRSLFVYEGTTRVGELFTSDATWFRLNQSVAKNIYTPRAFCAVNGLISGGSVIPGVGDVLYTNQLISYKATVQNEVYAVKSLLAPLTSTSYDGDSFSTTGKTLLDLSALFGMPAAAKQGMIRLLVRDSGSAASTQCWWGVAPNATSGSLCTAIWLDGEGNDRWREAGGLTALTTSGDVYRQNVASGAGLMEVYMQFWGYTL